MLVISIASFSHNDINSLQNDILDCSKLKAFAEDRIKILIIFVFDRLKTLWRKKKMLVTSILVTSIFFFSLNVFKRVVKDRDRVAKS